MGSPPSKEASKIAKLSLLLGYIGLAVWFAWFAADVVPSWARAMVATAMLWPSTKSMLFRYKAVQWQLLHRQLRKNGGQMLVQKDNANMCVLEFNNFFLYITEVLDLGVMKYAQEIPLLVQQEYLHAKMHRQGKQQQEADTGYSIPFIYRPFRALFHSLLLRMGQTCGTAVALQVETASANAFYTMDRILLAFGEDGFTDLTLFHFFEEAEHGALTTQTLLRKTPFLARLISLPLGWLLYFAVFCFMPILGLLRNPWDLARSPLKTITDIAVYCLAVLPVFAEAALRQVATVFAGSNLPTDSHSEMLKIGHHFNKRVNDRGILFDVEDRRCYEMVMFD
jgi:hypothetical protein